MMYLRQSDDFDQRKSHPIEVQQMDVPRLRYGLGCVLLHLYLLNANPNLISVFLRNAVMGIQCDVSIFRERFVVLCDLVARRLIPMEVVLPIKSTFFLYVAIQC